MYATGSATVSLIVFCSFVFRIVDFITDDFFFFKKEEDKWELLEI